MVDFVEDADALAPWLGRLLELGLVQSAGRTKGTRYFVAPLLLREANIKVPTSLRRIEPHRLRALILEDLARYPDSSSTDVNRRIGAEISARTVKWALDSLAADGLVGWEGKRRWRKYRLTTLGHKRHAGE